MIRTKLFVSINNNSSGQILTSVIVFLAFGLSVVALSAALTVINIQSSMKYSESARSLNYAEAGVEEAVMRLLRDPSYSGGALTLDDGNVTIQIIEAGSSRNITSTSTYNGFTKKIYAVVTLDNNTVNLVSWSEII